MLTWKYFVREKAVRVKRKVLAVYFDFLIFKSNFICGEVCVLVEIFADWFLLGGRERLLGRKRLTVVFLLSDGMLTRKYLLGICGEVYVCVLVEIFTDWFLLGERESTVWKKAFYCCF